MGNVTDVTRYVTGYEWNVTDVTRSCLSVTIFTHLSQECHKVSSHKQARPPALSVTPKEVILLSIYI